MARRPARLFVSYSHADEAFKDQLLSHLALLRSDGSITPWTDRDIVAGEAWEVAIFDQLDAADLIVLLISADFLASPFCYEREAARALEHHAQGKARVVPVIVRPCDWKSAPFGKLQGLPKDARPVSTWTDRDSAWLDVAQGLRRLLDTAEPEAAPFPHRTPRISTSSLPASRNAELVGRDAELRMLDDAWRDPKIRALSIVAIGGAGKTALVDRWLQRLEDDAWRGAEVVFVWSFYSQGAGEDRQATGDAFIDAALRFFGDADPSNGSPRARGLRLAGLVRRQRTLLVLDGMEPIQEPPTSGRAGRIKDPAVVALVRELASTQPGLLVITTREPVADLLTRIEGSAPSHDLERLSNAAGAHLLRRLGVEGRNEELEEVASELRGHCLAITLLGTYLRDACNGDVRAWREVPLLDASEMMGDDKAFRVMARYAEWFDRPEQQILSILGLFDRPADLGAVEALRNEPAIPGLTDQVAGMSSARWKLALEKLRTARLLLDDPLGASDALDAHPLVREHFGRVLETDDLATFRAGHVRLYEFYAAAAPDLPDTLDEMQPLYRAVHHGCKAGRQKEVFFEVYQRRIERGAEAYGVKKLGAFGSELAAVSAFFERTWDRPSDALGTDVRAFLLNAAAFRLRALGRLDEAVQPMEASGLMDVDREEWVGAAISYSNISGLTLALGRVDDAVGHGASSVELADRSGDGFWRMASRATSGEALHAAGRLGEAASAFREAESMQAELQPQYPKLYSLQGYSFCDLLLGKATPLDGMALSGEVCFDISADNLPTLRHQCEEVRGRAAQTLEWSRDGGLSLLTIALDQLSLGRAQLGLALADGRGFEDAVTSLDAAVRGLRAAGTEHHVPRGLFARAMLRRFIDEVSAAEADLAEALEVAERGSMRLHECDAHLEWGRLRWSVGDRDGAWAHLERAAELVEETGYHRRDREVAELRAAVGG